MTAPQEDRWLLPRHQTEYPTWELISEAKLHGRREATFLALAAMSLVGITALLVLGATRIIDLAGLLATVAPDVAWPIGFAVPLGVVPFALGLVAVMLACELYGRRRASALVWAGVFASAAVVGLLRVAELFDGSDAAFGPALALASCSVVAHGVAVLVFDAMRRRMRGRHLWLRAIVAMVVAQLVGWAAYAGVSYGYAHGELATIAGLAIGSALVATACVVAATLPLAIAARALTLFLRVSRREPVEDDDDLEALPVEPIRRRLPPAVIVDADDEPRPRRRAARASIQPYSSAEMRFFIEGDQLGESS